MEKKGYLYIATGDKYINEAVNSVTSLKKSNPDAHATLITDKKVQISKFDRIIIRKNNHNSTGWKEGILYKVKGLLSSPYEKTFFIDTDTYFVDDCSELFNVLDYFDLLISHAPADSNKIMIEGKYLEGYYPYNTGVIVFNKNSIVEKLFSDWIITYKNKFNVYPHDQAPFMEALLNNKVKIYVLQSIYNFRTPSIVTFLPLKVKIIHGRMNDYESLSKKINSSISQRAWVPEKRRKNLIWEEFGWKNRIIRILSGWL